MNYQEFKNLVAENAARNWGGSNLWEQSKGLFERWIYTIEINRKNNYGLHLGFEILHILRKSVSLKDVENVYCAFRYTDPILYNLLDIREEKCKISK